MVLFLSIFHDARVTCLVSLFPNWKVSSHFDTDKHSRLSEFISAVNCAEKDGFSPL